MTEEFKIVVYVIIAILLSVVLFVFGFWLGETITKYEALKAGAAVLYKHSEDGETMFKWVSPNNSPAKNSSKENIKFNIPSANPKK